MSLSVTQLFLFLHQSTTKTHFSNRISVKLFRTSVHCWW